MRVKRVREDNTLYEYEYFGNWYKYPAIVSVKRIR